MTAALPTTGLSNAMTVDVEDYFQVSALAPHIERHRWDAMPCRVERNVERLLQLFERYGAHATFFTLGWIAERYPRIVRSIAAAGHEIASHGYGRLLARAPSFSIGHANPWAFDCIAEAGYRYSSSVYPVRHDHYGMPDAPRFPYEARPGLLEIPLTTARCLGRNLPAAGGGYFRFFPYPVSRWAIRQVNRVDGRPAIFYFHPWEIDPDQPRVPGVSVKTRFRHYINLHRTEARLSRLLADFHWDRVDRAFGLRAS
jgi:peptidoglycan/xylan/chitin deacetylase (PgdA/CDA1 family)